jgi:DNA-binding GntR family transcriptional regulator
MGSVSICAHEVPPVTELSTDDDDGPRSLTDAVALRIQKEILSGRIPPGERLRLRSLQELFGVSHIPIREALRRLEGIGLVEILPQRGAIVARIAYDEFTDVYDLRKIIEPEIAARATERITPSRLKEIKEALDELDAEPEGSRSPHFDELHRRFHWLICEPGSTPVIERVVKQLWQTSDRYVHLSLEEGGTASQAQRQHRKLYEAIRKGDPKTMRRELAAHLENTEQGLRRAVMAATTPPAAASGPQGEVVAEGA